MLLDFEKDVNGKTISFDGNTNLKGAGTKLAFTKEHVEEYLKCKEDIQYFAEQYYHIISIDEGLQKIIMRDYQKNLVTHFIDNRFSIVLASRQCVTGDAKIRIRNKKTGEIENISIAEFSNNISNQSLKNNVTSKKFETIYEIDDYEILTDSGWESFDGIGITPELDVIEVVFLSGNKICGSPDHVIFLKDYSEKTLKDIELNDEVLTSYGVDIVTSKKFLEKKEIMYDILDVNKNRYFTNDILSHNCGKSTSFEVFVLHYILFQSDKTVAILANKESSSTEILRKIKMAYELLPKWLQQGVVTWNFSSIELENGSRCFASATSSSSIRSRAVSLLIIDECSFIPGNIWDNFYSSSYPTISSGKKSKIIFVSTPNGLNHFYKFWRESELGINEFANFRVDWWQVPGRDESWKEETIKNIGIKKFSQEFGNCIEKNQKITIRNKVSGEIREIKIKELLKDQYK